MRHHHVQKILRYPFYVNCKKHCCINCGEILRKIKTSKIVNSNSPEAENFDFHTVDSYMIGNVRFIHTEFQCPKCKRKFTIDEIKEIEKQK